MFLTKEKKAQENSEIHILIFDTTATPAGWPSLFFYFDRIIDVVNLKIGKLNWKIIK